MLPKGCTILGHWLEMVLGMLPAGIKLFINLRVNDILLMLCEDLISIVVLDFVGNKIHIN